MKEGIKGAREGEKSPLHQQHFEVQPDAARIVASFNSPARQEGKESF